MFLPRGDRDLGVVREFEDAILFKVAVMVKQYLNSQNNIKF